MPASHSRRCICSCERAGCFPHPLSIIWNQVMKSVTCRGKKFTLLKNNHMLYQWFAECSRRNTFVVWMLWTLEVHGWLTHGFKMRVRRRDVNTHSSKEKSPMSLKGKRFRERHPIPSLFQPSFDQCTQHRKEWNGGGVEAKRIEM